MKSLAARAHGSGRAIRPASLVVLLTFLLVAGALLILSASMTLGAPLLGGQSPCYVSYRGSGIDSPWVVVGRPLLARTRVTFACPERARPAYPYHLMMVADAGAFAPGGAAAHLHDDLIDFAWRMQLDSNARAHVGLVGYRDQAQAEMVCRMYDERQPLDECVRHMVGLRDEGASPVGRSPLAAGVDEALKELWMARQRVAPSETDDPLVEALLVLAAPGVYASTGYCAGVRDAFDEARARRIEVSVVCLGDGCDSSCLPKDEDPDDPWYRVYPWQHWDEMASRHVRRVFRTRLRVRWFDLFEVVNPTMVVDEPTIDAGGYYDPERHSLSWWQEVPDPDQALVMTYVVRPQEVGDNQPVRLDGALFATDSWDDQRTADIPGFEVDVIADPLPLAHRAYLPQAWRAWDPTAPPLPSDPREKPLGR